MSRKKWYITRCISQPGTNFLSAGFSFCVAQVEYQGQTRYTRIFERKPFINASHRVRRRLELKYFHSVRGMSRRKSLTRPSFFLYFREFMNKQSHLPCGQSAPTLYNRYNLCPCARPANVGECGPGPEFKFSKNSGRLEVGWS